MTESQQLQVSPIPHEREHSWKVACSLLGAAQGKLWKQFEQIIPVQKEANHKPVCCKGMGSKATEHVYMQILSWMHKRKTQTDVLEP